MKRIICAVLACLVLCACAAPAGSDSTVPATVTSPTLRPGFYVPVDEEYASLMIYAELRADGTGDFSVMGIAEPIEWEPTKFCLGDMTVTATPDGFSLRETETVEFTYVGDALPAGYLPDPPASGVYAVSSIGYQGNMEFYNTLTRDNGYLELRPDGAGTLVFRDTAYPFTMDGTNAQFDGWSMLLVDMSAQDTGGPAMVVGYTYDGVIEAESIAFRLLEGE